MKGRGNAHPQGVPPAGPAHNVIYVTYPLVQAAAYHSDRARFGAAHQTRNHESISTLARLLSGLEGRLITS